MKCGVSGTLLCTLHACFHNSRRFSDACCESSPSTPHILSLINKVVAVQISRLYLMSTSTPGLGLILSLCFETDGYYYNKKVANYFSSRRQKQLTTGIMCWLKSIPVSMKGEKKTLSFSTQSVGVHPQLKVRWPWPEHSCPVSSVKIFFADVFVALTD